ncbi:hypothetical protein ABPG74_021398 [Tetrahymena malaccensis]
MQHKQKCKVKIQLQKKQRQKRYNKKQILSRILKYKLTNINQKIKKSQELSKGQYQDRNQSKGYLLVQNFRVKITEINRLKILCEKFHKNQNNKSFFSQVAPKKQKQQYQVRQVILKKKFIGQ